jgi:subtilisin family serine protease
MIRRTSPVIRLAAALLPLALVAAPGPSSQSPAGSDTVTAGPSAVPGGASSPPSLEFSPQLEWPLATFQASRLWKHSLGAGVTVAVVDTGIDLRQPDLAGAVSSALDLTARKPRDYGFDESLDSHGTAVAGIIAARGSAAGAAEMVGLAPAASLIDIRVAVQPDRVSAAAVAQGIMSAAQAGAAIINVSLIVPAVSQKLDDAVSYAQARGCLIVAAAGNAAAPQALASYPGVLTVAAANQVGETDTTPAGGPATVSAPGIDLFSAGEIEGAGAAAHGYVRDVSGSGFSAAYVTAATALLLAADPKLGPAAVARLLIKTAKRPPGVSVPAIDPLAALDSLLPPSPTRPSGGDSAAVTEAIAFGVVGVLIVILGARVLAVRRHRASRLALEAIPPSSWDQPW